MSKQNKSRYSKVINCEICGERVFKKSPKQKYCSIHTVSVNAIRGSKNPEERLAALKAKYAKKD